MGAKAKKTAKRKPGRRTLQRRELDKDNVLVRINGKERKLKVFEMLAEEKVGLLRAATMLTLDEEAKREREKQVKEILGKEAEKLRNERTVLAITSGPKGLGACSIVIWTKRDNSKKGASRDDGEHILRENGRNIWGEARKRAKSGRRLGRNIKEKRLQDILG